jgi:O-antigen ligase
LAGLFFLGLLISTFATDVKYTAIFGEYHRKNGFLTYFSMSALLAATTLAFKLDSSIRYFRFLAITGLSLTAYGFLQGAGLDPVGWVIDYNPYITTLGNPNFTSGLLGLTGIAIFYLILETRDRRLQAVYFLGLICDLYILNKSNSVQGIFGFALGALIIALVKLWLFRKRIGQIGLVLSAMIGTPVILAVFNIGPLASKVYQSTLINRVDYWDAAINMFKSKPIFGVGIDRFGEYYREYAVQNQSVQGQITDNAHSVYLQLLATGGLALFLPYLALIFYITFVGFKSLISFQGNNKLIVGGVFGIWVSILAVNTVAIDNIGVGVWFWITGGLLLSVSQDVQVKDEVSKIKISKEKKSIQYKDAFPVTQVIAFVAGLLALILLVPEMNKSSMLLNLKRSPMSYTAQTNELTLVSESKKWQSDPQYLIQLSNLAFSTNKADVALDISRKVVEIDPRSFYGNYSAALVHEALGNWSEAIKYRELLRNLDPWNNSSLIALMKSYLKIGNMDSAKEIANTINENYPGSPADLEASMLLAG